MSPSTAVLQVSPSVGLSSKNTGLAVVKNGNLSRFVTMTCSSELVIQTEDSKRTGDLATLILLYSVVAGSEDPYCPGCWWLVPNIRTLTATFCYHEECWHEDKPTNLGGQH